MNLVILLPKYENTGPIKGGIALANLFCNEIETKIIFLKGHKEMPVSKDRKIKVYNLNKYSNPVKKGIELRKLIYEINDKDIILLSMCLSADTYTLFVNDLVSSISSIRGNLVKNYFFTYKFLGYFLAFFHLNIIRFFDLITVMNNPMKKQVKMFSSKDSSIIPNFIDEKNLSKYFNNKIDKNKPLNFVFLGSLIKRKNPIILLKSIKEINKEIDAELHFIGDGFLYTNLKYLIKKMNLEDKVFLHGFLEKPYNILSKSDLLVIPSFSEGTSRAALEALYLGVPVLMRDVDGNDELINIKNNNGNLFSNDKDITKLMLKEANKSRLRQERKNLLPYIYKSKNIKSHYLKLFKRLIEKK